MPRLKIYYGLKVLALFALSYLCLQLLANNTLVGINISHSHSDDFKVYWTTANDASWTESKSASVYVNSRKQHHILRLPVGLSDIQTLRIDPGEKKGVKTEISEISLYNLSAGKVSFNKQGGFKKFEARQHISDLKRGSTLSFVADGNDPGFIVDFSATISPPSPLLMLVQAGLLALVLLSLFSCFGWLVKDLRWVPAGLLLVGCSIIVMSMISRQNSHPDEHVHLAAASYYSTNLIAPRVCSKESLHTYSAYGVSRLNNREIAYYAGGRYLQLVDFMPAADYLKLRFFNIAMFFVLVLLAFCHVRARYLFLPLLLTPQAWYLFSYYNSDALSLFTVCFTAYLIFVPQSVLRRLLRGERPPGFVLWVAGLALIVAMQFWLKLNYVFYPILLGMLGASWWLLNRRIPDMTFTRPLWLALALGSALFLSWEVSRHAINDFAMGEQILDCREQMADFQYKPSTPLDQTHYNFRLRDKGLSLYHILLERNWAERIFYTGLGAYGYTEYLNQTVHYELASAFILLLLAYVVVAVALRGGAIGRLSVLSMLAALFGITAAAAYFNWTGDYQPQGRYLMVYLPILGTLIALYWRNLSVFWLSILSMMPFVLGLYSFYAIALLEIPK
jgi:hypothetical protein